jgi:hypothetical protein
MGQNNYRFNKGPKYYELVPLIEKELENAGEILGTPALMDRLGITGTAQSTFAAIIELASKDDDSQIASGGWAHLPQMTPRGERHYWVRVWGLKSWKIKELPEPPHMTSRRETRAATERAKKRAKNKAKREAAAREIVDAPVKPKGKGGHKEHLVIQLGSQLTVIGIALGDGDDLLYTVRDATGRQFNVVQQGE